MQSRKNTPEFSTYALRLSTTGSQVFLDTVKPVVLEYFQWFFYTERFLIFFYNKWKSVVK